MAPFARTVAMLIVLQTGTVVYGSSCSEQNRTSNLTSCLDHINHVINDNTSFWFGENYTRRCPNGEANGLFCTNPNPNAKSMALRIFSKADGLRIQLDRFLELHFESTGRNYTACHNTFKDPESDVWRMDTDPTSDTIVYPWFVKNFPISVSWNYVAGDVFTLVVYDVGYLKPHAVYINIQGDDITTREELKAYHGPLITSDLENPYIFMLFKQDSHINVSQEWKCKIKNNQEWTIDSFIAAYSLTGLVAANWIVATGDEWAAQVMLDNQDTAMCTVFATRALHKLKPRPFIPTDTALTVWIHFEFSTEGHTTTACSNTYTFNAHNFSINQIGNPGYNTWELRDASPHKVSLLKQGAYSQATNFTDDMYMIVAVIPKAAFATAGTEEKPLLNGLVTNIINGSLKTGDEGLGWIGPRPPDCLVHLYYILLYKQESTLNASEVISNYTGSSCVPRLVGRCLFDISLLISEHNLKLVGATWMTSHKDGYVLERLLEAGTDEKEVCEGQPGYKNPCTTDGTAALIPSICTICVVCLLSLFSS